MKKFLSFFVIFLFLVSGCSDETATNPLYPESIRVLKLEEVKVLSIGNSFSQDATEQYLYELFAAAKINVTIGNMCISGCSLETHWDNLVNNNKAYTYYKISDGKLKTYTPYRLQKAILEEDWDVIILQQFSGLADDYSSYIPFLNYIIDWIHSHSDAKILFHQTWTYSQDYIDTLYSDNDVNQENIYLSTTRATIEALENNAYLTDVIPSGTAIQNGRTSNLGDSFNRDGVHLETTYGRFTVACTWYEKLSGYSIFDNPYNPDFDSYNIMVAKTAAHYAIMNPFCITDLSELLEK